MLADLDQVEAERLYARTVPERYRLALGCLVW